MKKTILKILGILLLCSVFVVNTSHVHHVHADVTECPYCGSTNIVLISTTATCTEDGDARYKCLDCANNPTAVSGSDFSGPKSALGHDYVTSTEKQPTCIEEGTTLHKCSRCGDSYTEPISKIDHQYTQTIIKNATCLASGTVQYTCTTCGDNYTETIAALGHSFKVKEKENPTCTEDGFVINVCTRCKKEDKKVLKALEHSFKEKENVEPTCTEDGYILRICKRCNEEEKEILKAFGHDVILEIKKEATCTEEGLKSGICKTCNEEISEKIPAIGHSYPKDWTIEKEASILKEGSESKTCATCGDIIYEAIPKKEIPPLAYAGASLVLGGGIALILLKKKAAKKVAKGIIEEAIEEELLKPSFEEKTIVTSIKNDAFYKTIKIQKYIKVIESEYDKINEAIEENEPSLTIIDISELNIEDVFENLKSIKDELDSPPISLLASSKQIEDNHELLEEGKQNELIKDYINVNTNSNVILVKIVLPVMKPDLKSDEALENIGMVADALSIPGISTIIDTFITGREIKTTYEEGKEEGLSFVDKSVIISDIASILHLDTVSSVAGLVSDLDDIKSSLVDSKIGGNEVSTTKDAVSDIIDVISDITDNG